MSHWAWNSIIMLFNWMSYHLLLRLSTIEGENLACKDSWKPQASIFENSHGSLSNMHEVYSYILLWA